MGNLALLQCVTGETGSDYIAPCIATKGFIKPRELKRNCPAHFSHMHSHFCEAQSSMLFMSSCGDMYSGGDSIRIPVMLRRKKSFTKDKRMRATVQQLPVIKT